MEVNAGKQSIVRLRAGVSGINAGRVAVSCRLPAGGWCNIDPLNVQGKPSAKWCFSPPTLMFLRSLGIESVQPFAHNRSVLCTGLPQDTVMDAGMCGRG